MLPSHRCLVGEAGAQTANSSSGKVRGREEYEPGLLGSLEMRELDSSQEIRGCFTEEIVFRMRKIWQEREGNSRLRYQHSRRPRSGGEQVCFRE